MAVPVFQKHCLKGLNFIKMSSQEEIIETPEQRKKRLVYARVVKWRAIHHDDTRTKLQKTVDDMEIKIKQLELEISKFQKQ